ncbi:MAG: TlpA family protein disulfide reductase [Puniceicoccaceae bacterium]|nr:MAG: TlpA family protein disulfide reductase [Puniceicoccaceae bacterium]
MHHLSRSLRAATFICLGGVFLAPAATASDPVAEAVQQFRQATSTLPTPQRDDREAVQVWSDGRRQAAVDILDSFDFDRIDAETIAGLSNAPHSLIQIAGRTSEAVERLDELSRLSTAEGARALIVHLRFLPSVARGADADAQRQARTNQHDHLTRLLEHPGLREALPTMAGDVFQFFRRIDSDVLLEIAPKLTGLPGLLSTSTPPEEAAPLRFLVQAVLDLEDRIDPSLREGIRTAASNAARRILATNEDHTALTQTLEFIDGAFARDELVGHPAPELHFSWHTLDDNSVQTLSDLQGQVVVLDFWATWCGPCVASFPDVAQLQEHYEGYPVVILGVTSLQGQHISRPGGLGGPIERIATRDDPEREFELMKSFMEQMDMTWPVAFSEERVFNPDYGVRGIPHVAIIDPAGVVRYRGLHPSSRVTPREEKLGMINGLLQEFDLPHPR